MIVRSLTRLERVPSLSLRFGLVAVGLCLSASCVEIHGGAVEVSWALSSRDGQGISDCSCAGDPHLDQVRLEMRPLDSDGGAAARTWDFACQRQVGSTAFDVTPGRYQFQLVGVDATGGLLPPVLDSSGVLIKGVRAPAPIVQEVVTGQPTQLQAMLLETPCATECLNSSGVCARP